MRSILTVIPAILLSACATTYQQPEVDAAHSTITFEKGYLDGVGFGTSSSQSYTRLGEAGCKKPEKMALMTWVTGKQKTVRVAPDTPIEILATNSNTSPAGGYWNGYAYIANTASDICQSKLTLTPQNGKEYFVKLVEQKSGECLLEVKDMATDNVPPDAIIEDSYTCS